MEKLFAISSKGNGRNGNYFWWCDGSHYDCTVCCNYGEGIMYTHLIFPRTLRMDLSLEIAIVEFQSAMEILSFTWQYELMQETFPIPALTRFLVMQYWLSTGQWWKQYPQKLTSNGTVNVLLVMSKYKPEDNIKYCPEWIAGNKVGWPKMMLCVTGVVTNPRERRKKCFSPS